MRTMENPDNKPAPFTPLDATKMEMDSRFKVVNDRITETENFLNDKLSNAEVKNTLLQKKINKLRVITIILIISIIITGVLSVISYKFQKESETERLSHYEKDTYIIAYARLFNDKNKTMEEQIYAFLAKHPKTSFSLDSELYENRFREINGIPLDTNLDRTSNEGYLYFPYIINYKDE